MLWHQFRALVPTIRKWLETNVFLCNILPQIGCWPEREKEERKELKSQCTNTALSNKDRHVTLWYLPLPLLLAPKSRHCIPSLGSAKSMDYKYKKNREEQGQRRGAGETANKKRLSYRKCWSCLIIPVYVADNVLVHCLNREICTSLFRLLIYWCSMIF